MVLLGAGVGAGIVLIRRALAPRPPSIAAVLAGLARPGIAIDGGPPGRMSTVHPTGSIARRAVEALGYDPQRHHQELELVGRTPERHALDKLLGAVAGLLVPNIAGAALVAIGVPVPLGIAALLSLAAAAAGS